MIGAMETSNLEGEFRGVGVYYIDHARQGGGTWVKLVDFHLQIGYPVGPS